jgi:hypothetical protein
MHRESQHISAEAETRGPDDTAIEEKEGRPRHAISTGEQCGKHAQEGDKLAEKDDHASITAKEILAEPESLLVEPYARAMAPQDRKSDQPTDLVADVVADHSASGRSSNDADNIQFVARAA